MTGKDCKKVEKNRVEFGPSQRIIQVTCCALMSLQRGSGYLKRMTSKVNGEKLERTFYKQVFWQGSFRLPLKGQSRVPTWTWFLASSPSCSSSQLHTDGTLQLEETKPNLKQKYENSLHWNYYHLSSSGQNGNF